ncbi:hypothetical protein SAMN05216474_2588 [Lishizhenia tianjinensis]|uniref:Urease accessory protein UreH-like transmembrane domain-containing protein n=1 Tax=Lishizhenia tianjinensis TaxID=477690 RepID=A0A1I7B936_9FLAO|nr:sulfite exporter TauE/SafE family protein [Lishizhenia tianjinensis]SFT83716.1 hypothetical protein SAMN05216474_2588 [Lishizhenia tianjinensis]
MLWTALTLGLISNLHCLGMCGPIALALPVGNMQPLQKFISIFTYNFGRITVYTLLGLVLGFFGSSLKLIGFLQGFSILAGIALILIGLSEFGILKFKLQHVGFKALNQLKGKFAQLLQKRSLDAFFMMGIFNGLLPCGMVYSALIASLVMGSVQGGATYMFLYGIGTLPVMFFLPFFKSFFHFKAKRYLKILIPASFILIGGLLVLRGANLGIPYMSPALQEQIGVLPANQINCH